MSIQKIIEILNNKVSKLSQDIAISTQLGDLQRVVELQNELNETQVTLSTLQSL